MTFAELLNENELVPSCKRGKVTLQVVSPEDEDAYVKASAEVLERVGFKSGYVEAHPEGSDRGGYVPTVYSRDEEVAYYDENGDGWLEG